MGVSGALALLPFASCSPSSSILSTVVARGRILGRPGPLFFGPAFVPGGFRTRVEGALVGFSWLRRRSPRFAGG